MLVVCHGNDSILATSIQTFVIIVIVIVQVRTDLVTREVVRDVVKAILVSGQQTAQKEKSRSPLMYYWHDKAYVGAAHGFIGILFMLLQVGKTFIS